MTPLPADLAARMPVRKPVWDHGEAHKDEVKTTWLGHAAFLIEMPHHAGAERGIRILTDPVLGDYCAPVSAAKLKRITRAHLSHPYVLCADRPFSSTCSESR